MFESVLAVPLHFTIEFLGFLVAAGGALIVLSRPNLVPGATSNRVAAALGLLTFAAAQVLHGGAFIAHEGDPRLVGIRALAFAFMLIGVSGGLRPGTAAIAGFEVREPLVFVPAGAAFLLGTAALSAVRGGVALAPRRLAAGAFLLAGAEFMTVAAPRFEVGTFDRFGYAAHALKAFGFIALSAWIWSAVRSSIRTRFVASFVALLVAVILALSTALTAVISTNVQREELDRIEAQAVSATETLERRRRSVDQEVNTLARLPEVRQGIRGSGNLNRLARRIRQLQIGEDRHFVIVDPFNGSPGVAGHRAYRSSDQEQAPRLRRIDVIDVLGTPIVGEVRNGRPSSANVVRVGESVALVAASRIQSPNGGRGGVLTIGRWIDALTVEEISATVNAPASLIVGNEVFASELPGAHAARLTVPESTRVELSRQGRAATQQTLGDSSYFTGFAYIQGPRVAVLAISSQATVVTSGREATTRLLFLAAMLVGAIALVLAWLSGRRITRPIQELTTTAGAVREGDLTAQANVEGEDEVGRLGETFNEMTAALLKMTDDLKTAAREEHNLRARIETIMQSMADGLIAVDANRRVLAFNREAENLTGLPADEAIDRPVDEVLVALDSQGSEISLPVHSLGEGSMGGIFVRRRDGDPVPVAVTSAVLKGENEDVQGAVAVLRDMTREREIERMKTEFLSNISHELRTPLTPIKGYAEILERADIPRDKSLKFVRGILESTARLERIVELLVDFSAMEAGRLAPRTSQVDLAAMLEGLATEWKERSTAHEIVAEVSESDLDVIGDERLLRRSLEEVLDNAVKFSPDGGTIRLQGRSGAGWNGDRPGRYVEITVADPGIGIRPEDLPRIFSDFQQLDGSETRSYGGLGLGLAFVQRIVQAHDGTVRVESEPEAGTRLMIALPAAQAEPEGAEGGADEEPEAVPEAVGEE